MTPIEFERIKEAFIEATFGIGADIHLYSSEWHDDTEFIGEPMSSESARHAPASSQDTFMRKKSLPDLLDRAKQSPSLGAYIRNKAYRSNMIAYRSATFEQGQISRDYWSKLLNDEIKPSKEKLLRVAVLLQLGIEELEDLLGQAGYALSPIDLRDVVVSFCLREGHYDFIVIEQLLADNDIQSLFNDRRSS